MMYWGSRGFRSTIENPIALIIIATYCSISPGEIEVDDNNFEAYKMGAFNKRIEIGYIYI